MGVYDQLNQLNRQAKTPAKPQEETIFSQNSEPEASKSEQVDHTPVQLADTMIPRHRATVADTTVAVVRQAVKQLGKEAATHRFTEAEKRALAQLIFTYRNQSIRTSENEITRIAINFLIQDYEQHGEDSVLHRIIMAIHQ